MCSYEVVYDIHPESLMSLVTIHSHLCLLSFDDSCQGTCQNIDIYVFAILSYIYKKKTTHEL
jgi:hypothetical protein